MSFILRCVFVPALLFLSLRAQAPYTIQTIVGEDFPDGLVATEVSLGQIGGLAVDGNGDLYIASAGKYRVFKVTKDGKITTFAKQPPNATFLESFFVLQGGIAFDSLGNLYVSCGFFGGIKKIDSTGKITNFYNQPPGYDFAPYALAADRFGNVFAVDQRASLVYKIDPNGSATSFRTNFQTNDLPTGIAVDKAGDVYLSDSNSHVIRRVSASGAVTVFAGTGEAGSSGDGGAATKAQLHTPEGLAIDLQGNLFIIDGGAIRKVDLSGIITTVYVNPVFFFDFIAVDISGNVYFCDSITVYRMDPTGAVAVFAGNHSNSHSGDGGPAIAAQVDSPRGMLLDASGNLLLSDFEGSVRKVNSQGVITSVVTQAGYDPLTGEATPQSVASIAYDRAANLLVADTAGQRILSYTPSGVVSTIAGKAYVRGYAGDGGPATQALLERPDYVIFDPSGNLLISEQANHVIRKIDIGGTITTVAGTGIAGFSGDNGLATKAQLNNPRQIAVDSFGNIYIADSHNHRIRKVGPDGVITSVAGNGFFGTSGDGGPAISAALSTPSGVIVDSTGNLYIAQYGAVRQVDSAGIITTIAGGGTLQSVEGIPATDASLGALHNLLLGKSGEIYVSGNGVLVLTPGTTAVPAPQVTIDSSPQTLGFTISGDQCPVGTYVTPEYLTFPGSDSCTITFNQTYSAPRGGRYVFDSWVDSASATVQRTVVAPKGAATEYFARFQLRYPLTLSVQPAALAGRASIQTAPPSPDGFFNAATQVTITAKSPPGYTFTGFSGGLSGTQNGQTLNLNAATTVVANFAPHALPRGNAGVFRQGFL